MSDKKKLLSLAHHLHVLICLSFVSGIQLASIPGLEDVTVSTPAPGQPGDMTAASAPAPAPASDAPQTATEVDNLHFLCVSFS